MPCLPEHLFSLDLIYFKAVKADIFRSCSIKPQGLSRTENEIQVLSRPWNRTPEIQGFSRRIRTLPSALYRRDHRTDKHLSLTVCTKPKFLMSDKRLILSTNALKFVIFNSLTNHSISFLLLYRKNTTNIHESINNLNDLLSVSSIDIIMGDFNINYFNDTTIMQLKELMNFYAYKQVVQSATFVPSGSSLDLLDLLIYVKQTDNYKLKVLETNIVSVYN